jgi:hypothetical protein
MKCAERRENAIICGRKAHAKGGEVAFQRDKRRERFGRDHVQPKLKKKWRAPETPRTPILPHRGGGPRGAMVAAVVRRGGWAFRGERMTMSMGSVGF